MNFLQPNTRDALMLFGAEMCSLGSMSGLGDFGGLQLGTTICRKKLLQG
jgi:hypothetical protein